jgi:hypothetical protein
MIECSGWWQQKGFGRQPMNDLQLEFRGPTIYGRGTDIISPFTISGKLRPDGSVELIKKYDQRHTVLYVGTYDGEGSLNGKWDIGGYQGEWSIKFQRSNSAEEDDIQEIG